MAQHPDPEQLAAFQAGDGDRRQRGEVEAHLAGCPDCTELVASVARARQRLALLEEPQLPPGLHDRLAAVVEAEADAAATAVPLRRQVPWYRRPAALGAAAALLLAALVAVPLLDQQIGDRTTAGDAGGGAAQELAQGPQADAAASLPVIRVPGEVTAASVRSRLAADARARRALELAGARPRTSAAPAPGSGAQGSEAAPKGQGDTAGAGTTPQAGDAAPPAPSGGAPELQSCLPAATAAANPAITPLAPAFIIEGAYQGRPATVLVTTSIPQPDRVDLWVFPRGNCASPPLASERVR